MLPSRWMSVRERGRHRLCGQSCELRRFLSTNIPPGLSFRPPSASRQRAQSSTMRPLPLLENERKSCAIRSVCFRQSPQMYRFGNHLTRAGERIRCFPRTLVDLWVALRLVALCRRVSALLRSDVDPQIILARVSDRRFQPYQGRAGVELVRIRRAAYRAGRLAALLGAKNSCLTRSLVISALMARHSNALLHIGFRPGADTSAGPTGHAWVSLGSANISDLGQASSEQLSFVTARTIQVGRS